MNSIIFFRDKALEAADEAIKLTREQRLENFADILKIILNKSNGNISFLSL